MKISRKTYVVEISFNTVARILSTAYYRIKECTTDMLWMKSFDQPNASKKNHFISFSKDIGETTAMNVLENYIILYRRVSPPQHFLCLFREFPKLLGERLWWNHFFSKIKEASAFCNSVGKSNTWMLCFDKSSFKQSCRLTEYNFKIKLTDNFREMISNGIPYQEFTDLKVVALGLGCFKTLEIMSTVEFLFSETDANGFSTE